MNLNLVEIACVLDRSGSMESMKAEAIAGFNALLEDQKKEPGEVRFTLILFDNEYLKVIIHMPIGEVPKLTDKTFEPRGMTALLDAMGRTIDEIGQRLANTPEDQRPCKVIITCMTDGFENASRRYSNARIAEMIELQRTKYNWEFIFLGATLESNQMAKSWTLHDEDVVLYNASKEGTTYALEEISQGLYKKRRC